MRAHIGSERLIALTDGVVAVIITIMVLELKPPHGADITSLRELGPTFLSFVLSFVYVAIYWNNHHHFFRLVPHVSGTIMWANLNLLFWLSLIPFATAWMDEHGSAPVPVAVYGLTLLASAVSWRIMQAAIVRAKGRVPVCGRRSDATLRAWHRSRSMPRPSCSPSLLPSSPTLAMPAWRRGG